MSLVLTQNVSYVKLMCIKCESILHGGQDCRPRRDVFRTEDFDTKKPVNFHSLARGKVDGLQTPARDAEEPFFYRISYRNATSGKGGDPHPTLRDHGYLPRCLSAVQRRRPLRHQLQRPANSNLHVHRSWPLSARPGVSHRHCPGESRSPAVFTEPPARYPF